MIGAIIARPLLRETAKKQRRRIEWEDVQPYDISGTFPYHKTSLKRS